MKNFISIQVLAFAIMAIGGVPTSPAEDLNLQEMEAFLNQSQTERQQMLLAQVQNLLAELTSFLVNDVSLLNAYKDAYGTVHFEGSKKEHARVKAWEEQNKALLKEDSFLGALRLHLQYLIATLTKKLGNDEKAMGLTLDWIQAFPSTPEKFEKTAKHEVLKNGVAGSIFLKAKNQTGLLQGIECWHVGDLTNLPEIHRVNVIGFLRLKKDPQIFVQWQNNLRMEQNAAEREGLAAKKDHFTLHRHPWLLWQVGKDYAAYGDRKKAAEVMFQALKASPRSDDYEKIAADLRKIIAEIRAGPQALPPSPPPP